MGFVHVYQRERPDKKELLRRSVSFKELSEKRDKLK